MRQGKGCMAGPVCRIYLKGQHYVLWLKEARADQMKSACRRQRKTKKRKEEATQRQRKSKATQNMEIKSCGWSWKKKKTREEESKNSKVACTSIHRAAHCNPAHRQIIIREGTERNSVRSHGLSKRWEMSLVIKASVCIKTAFTGCARSNSHFFPTVSERRWPCLGSWRLLTPCWRDYTASRRHISSLIYIIN